MFVCGGFGGGCYFVCGVLYICLEKQSPLGPTKNGAVHDVWGPSGLAPGALKSYCGFPKVMRKRHLCGVMNTCEHFGRYSCSTRLLFQEAMRGNRSFQHGCLNPPDQRLLQNQIALINFCPLPSNQEKLA